MSKFIAAWLLMGAVAFAGCPEDEDETGADVVSGDTDLGGDGVDNPTGASDTSGTSPGSTSARDTTTPGDGTSPPGDSNQGSATTDTRTTTGPGGDGTTTGDGAGPDTTPPRCGDFGCPCDEDDDCESAYCVDTPDGKLCSERCDGPCGYDNYDCRLSDDVLTDPVSICYPSFLHLCKPCRDDDACDYRGGERCVPAANPDDGSFCTMECRSDGTCPEGYRCDDLQIGEATEAHCVPLDGRCRCREAWADLGLETDCQIVNEYGSCPGTRSCDESGLTSCGGTAAVPETCNNIDDDCDGETDNIAPDTPCALVNQFGTCRGVLSCNPDGTENCVGTAATEEVCDLIDQDCDDVPDNGTCDDGLACTVDSCVGVGKCDHDIAPNTCLIDGQCRAANEANPAVACQRCLPAVSTTAWSGSATGANCLIGGECVPDGAPNPRVACQYCDADTLSDGWSTIDPAEGDADNDGLADRCDPCTDIDGDGFGEAGYPASTCKPDICPGHDDTADADRDGVPDGCDTCTDSDGDGFGDPGYEANTCPEDRCKGHDDSVDIDGDDIPDGCDTCIDTDNDGYGDAGIVTNTCPPDVCQGHDDRADHDNDGAPDACDSCTDANGDGISDPGFPVGQCPGDACAPGQPLDPDACCTVGLACEGDDKLVTNFSCVDSGSDADRHLAFYGEICCFDASEEKLYCTSYGDWSAGSGRDTDPANNPALLGVSSDTAPGGGQQQHHTTWALNPTFFNPTVNPGNFCQFNGEGWAVDDPATTGDKSSYPGDGYPVASWAYDVDPSGGGDVACGGGTTTEPPELCIPPATGAPVHTVQLSLNADDGWQGWLNGTSLGPSQDTWTAVENSTHQLAEGCHVLAVHARDIHRVVSGFQGRVRIDGVNKYLTGTTRADWKMTASAPTDQFNVTWRDRAYDDSSAAWFEPLTCTYTGWYGVSAVNALRNAGAPMVWWGDPSCDGLGQAWIRLELHVP